MVTAPFNAVAGALVRFLMTLLVPRGTRCLSQTMVVARIELLLPVLFSSLTVNKVFNQSNQSVKLISPRHHVHPGEV